MKQIAIIDDHPLFSSGMSLLLEELDLPVNVMTFVSAKDFNQHNDPAFSLIILDYYLPGSDFGDTIKTIKQKCLDCPVVVISASPSSADKKAALSAGAIAFVAKHSHPEYLLQTISQVFDGSSGNVSVEPIQGNALGELPLSERQSEILILATKGYSNKEIASSLDISPETVKSHMKTIFQRIGVKSRIEAIEYLRENGVM